ncbi:N-acetyltransferase family protein [[Eubacterium] cellulosolvens]
MLKNIIIRPGRLRDKEQVVELWKELMEYHVQISSIDYEMVKDAPNLFMKFFENNVRSRNKKALVAEEDGEIIGYMLGAIQKRPLLFKTTHQAFITDAAVKRETRNQGVGTKLLESFAAWARERGMKYISLSVVPENESGIKFWQKQGFEIVMFSQRKML